jgi:hypothetical protein
VSFCVHHAPLMPEVIHLVRHAAWHRVVRDPWAGRAVPVVDPRDVADAVVRMLRYAVAADAVGGPEALTWAQVVGAVLANDARRPWWRALVGRWPSRAAASQAAAAALYPRLGRRRLADVLARRESGATRPVHLVSPAVPHAP